MADYQRWRRAFCQSHIVETEGVYLGAGASPEGLRDQWDDLVACDQQQALEMGSKHTEKFAMKLWRP